MRIWLLAFTLCSLLLLPSAGAGSLWVSAMHGTEQNNPAAVEGSATGNEYDHCASMAGTAVVTKVDANNEVQSTCCDDHELCDTECASDCGHCIVPGHGCSAATVGMPHTQCNVTQDAVSSVTSVYSLLLVKGNPPPIIT